MDYRFELFKSSLTLATSLLTLGLAWFVGNRISVRWAIRQKQREAYLSIASDFYRLYGEFFAIWKAWNYFKKHQGKAEATDRFPKETHWQILNRACAAEAGVEAILVRVCSERHLSPEDTVALGRFRQAYQRLREQVKNDEELAWAWSEHPEYLTFKELGAYVATILARRDDGDPPTRKEAYGRLCEVTSNKWENNWVSDGRNRTKQAPRG